MEQTQRQETNSTNTSRFSVFPKRPRRESGNDSDGAVKGPLGLNTLYEPPFSAIADLVFVHGLRGGSQSTWSKNHDLNLFWPREWLPKDVGFQDVRIHSFGYNSDLGKESTLNIYDFAKSLIGDIHDCPSIPRESDAPIIFVAHSMGGLVVKRAYILAKQQPGFSSVADRVRAMLFLATPHRGSDYAQLLSKILSISPVAPGARPFLTDITRNSLATQSINEEFPRVCQDLQLFSFYETLPTSVLKGLVVDKDLATLGYENERTAYLNADHRGVCKYSTKRDSSYQTVRNALATVIDDFRNREAMSKIKIDHEQLKLLDTFLGTSDAAEDELTAIESIRITGSCEWLMKRSSYLEWLKSANTQFYWVSAKPATGKTVLSGKVISHLKSLRRDCSFCFFDYGNKAKSNIASFLLSIARQMALLHADILRAVLELSRKDDQLKEKDYRTIWRILYVETILKQKLVQSQYWVVDALDECHLGSELVPMLAKAMKALPIRIFLTSRDSIHDYRKNIPGAIKVFSEEISMDDTLSDIELYLNCHMDGIPAENDEDRLTMKNLILKKSNGCFLWVSLVLQELKGVHTSDEIREVLEEVPSDMDELYSRILDSMSRQSKGTKLAKYILTWTVCAARPLTTDELHFAVQSQMKNKVYDIERAIKSYCGQLVYVDQQSRVQVIHQTVRDYLLTVKSTSDFGIIKRAGHKQLAMGCLDYLNSQELAGPTRRKLSASNINTQVERSAFANYACNFVSEHILQVSSSDDDILYALDKFLHSRNVLSWIEYVAQRSDFKRLIQTGKALKNFLQRRSRHMNPFGKEVALLDSWATDLIRLVAKFGKNLLENPSSIHHLIPPFCPPESAPRKYFTNHTRGIQLVGLSNKNWGDCLSTIIEPQEQFSGLGCSTMHFAIGTNSGTIRIFNQTTCQEVRTLKKAHENPVRLLRFGSREGILASASSKMVRIWDTITWTHRWEFKIPTLPLSICMAEEDQILLVSLKNNQFTTFDLVNGTQEPPDDWTQDLEGPRARSFSRPIAAACNVEESLLAVVYRGQDILLWYFEGDTQLETYTKDGGASTSPRRTKDGGALSVIFGAGPNVTLLAAAYLDGDLVVFDTSDGLVKNTTLGNAQILSSSPDGRTLATGDSAGTIQLYDFETLKLLYRISSDEFAIKSMKFSRDSCRIFEIRASQCRIWDPLVLVRQDTEDELSDTISISTAPQEIGTEPFEKVVLVSSLAVHRSKEVFFVGKEDGAVYLYKTKTGAKIKTLFNHADGVAIVGLYFDDEGSLLASIDESSRVMIHKFLPTDEVSDPIFDHRAGVAVDQLLFSHKHSRILICSAMADTLWEIDAEALNESRIIMTNEWDEVRSYRWATHPTNQQQLILIDDHIAHIYDWRTLSRLTGEEGISLDAKIDTELKIRSITPCFHCNGIATAFGESSNHHCKSKLLLWNASDFTPESSGVASIQRYHHLADDIDFLIHADDQKLVFLHSDNWICSTDPDNPSKVIRHFFLPADWLASNADLMIELAPDESILFVKRDEVAVIKRGLHNKEQSIKHTNDRRPSPLGGRRRSSGVVQQLSSLEFKESLLQETEEMLTSSDSN